MVTPEKTIEGPNTYWHYVWPTSWGYAGHKDGWAQNGLLTELTHQALTLGEQISKMSLYDTSQVTIEIEEDENKN